MRAYSMDLRERVLLDSDAGMKAADVASEVPRQRVVGAALETAAARNGRGGASRQRHGRRCMLEPHLHTSRPI